MILVIDNKYDTSYDNIKTGVLYIPNNILYDIDFVTERDDDSYE